eukprot:CAMPEP_0177549188 /NCGR_PEP_ID=MMETSP0369-20130122/64884_1 /TAXON_ID=447022 ORGANISM="Scrippsiella hangoei-like, Strain SHHI-4" /NCGR_SAMPLE_ID=MMETSP0369 /ASSEMBLY_ACC=CAM_ASM_000364 /LENGTH=99 /DNA_ID=CAMNT_0019034263 /DNA_START=156 /DNA_END=455 /DNA_ORIENTATION=-
MAATDSMGEPIANLARAEPRPLRSETAHAQSFTKSCGAIMRAAAPQACCTAIASPFASPRACALFRKRVLSTGFAPAPRAMGSKHAIMPRALPAVPQSI